MSSKSSNIDDFVQRSIKTRLDILSAMSFEEVAKLQQHTSEELTVQGHVVLLSVWRDQLETGAQRIVVQAYRPSMLGIGRMSADGFTIDATNARRALTQEEWAPFS